MLVNVIKVMAIIATSASFEEVSPSGQVEMLWRRNVIFSLEVTAQKAS